MAASGQGGQIGPPGAAATNIQLPMTTDQNKTNGENDGAGDHETLRPQPEAKIRRGGGSPAVFSPGTVITKVTAENVEEYLRQVEAWENAPLVTHREWLKRRGWRFHAPEKLYGHELVEELWRLIRALAEARVFIEHTDHLNDVALYEQLWREVLEGQQPDVPRSAADAWHWDLAEAGGEHETEWLMYYADEDEREEWHEMFPEVTLPEHRDPPYERDQLLPKWQ